MSDTAKASKGSQGSGIELQAHQVILRPLVTEKGVHRAARNRHYAFEIHPDATKTDVRRAIEELYNVVVEKVMTQNRQGKTRRYRQRIGVTSGWKKAVVKLSPEHSIDLF